MDDRIAFMQRRIDESEHVISEIEGMPERSIGKYPLRDTSDGFLNSLMDVFFSSEEAFIYDKRIPFLRVEQNLGTRVSCLVMEADEDKGVYEAIFTTNSKLVDPFSKILRWGISLIATENREEVFREVLREVSTIVSSNGKETGGTIEFYIEPKNLEENKDRINRERESIVDSRRAIDEVQENDRRDAIERFETSVRMFSALRNKFDSRHREEIENNLHHYNDALQILYP